MKAPAQGSPTDNVPVPHSGHGHHQEVDTVPVGQALTVREVRRISRIFKLKCLFLLLEKISESLEIMFCICNFANLIPSNEASVLIVFFCYQSF